MQLPSAARSSSRYQANHRKGSKYKYTGCFLNSVSPQIINEPN